MKQLGLITKEEIEQFVMHLNHMSDWLIYELLTKNDSSEGIL